MNIDEIKKRAEAATPGPWEAIKSTTGDYSLFAKINRALYMLGDVEETPDADFIAHAREDIPALIEKVDHYKQLEADGWLVTLPCKVGDTIFGLTLDKKHIIEFIADEFIYSNSHWFVMGTHGEGEFDWRDCYLTREEAEAALEHKRLDQQCWSNQTQEATT